ncbi:ATP synthase F0 subunit B [Actinacidiphila bryophytorum]|uniref:Cell division initiation protein n=1 Tax=Actinacidiphila bryophytorum TaxID=1436133 RepID=A0A9W4GZA9_9ACTN|nr:ATP synthase F0 subunit B [Actinacidiphila bryophytorum]MBM9435529.1 ATP synthase F0 subunit B [Actinacidiphila bryophytorum]MBN6546503.1 ATP synthase F0 subunit B [Actinacidiphila bryophytorum]CAG7609174.1 Cell division initiation protein [Actinacidiphila bryophytorum]
MDVQKKLDEIAATVANARSMPMSASCVVNRAELLAMLDEVSAALPDSLAQAEGLLGDREQMVEEARAEARRIIESAHAERGSLVSDTHIARQSKDEAERIVAEARREADEIRAEADDYVDSKLANFEVVLTKTIGSVDRGREKLLGRHPDFDEQGFPVEDDPDAPERSTDPETLRRRADEYVDTKLGAFEAVLSKTLEAVGRGRLKLTGHNPIDDLAAQIAAADGAEGDPQHHHQQSDADYLAGLAAPAPEQADLSQYGYDPQAQPAEPQPPAQDPGYGYQGQQEAYAQQAYAAEPGDGYQDDGYQQDYAQQAGYADPYAPQPGYGQDQGYDYGQGGQQGYEQQPGYDQQQYPPQIPYQQQGQGYAQPAAALDETSFFDTGMIDLNRLRELEQGR